MLLLHFHFKIYRKPAIWIKTNFQHGVQEFGPVAKGGTCDGRFK